MPANLPAAVVGDAEAFLRRHAKCHGRRDPHGYPIGCNALPSREACPKCSGTGIDPAAAAELAAILETAMAEARRGGAIDAMLGLEHDSLTDMEGADDTEFARAEHVAGVAKKRALLIAAVRTEERWTKPVTAIRQRTEQEKP